MKKTHIGIILAVLIIALLSACTSAPAAEPETASPPIESSSTPDYAIPKSTETDSPVTPTDLYPAPDIPEPEETGIPQPAEPGTPLPEGIPILRLVWQYTDPDSPTQSVLRKCSWDIENNAIIENMDDILIDSISYIFGLGWDGDDEITTSDAETVLSPRHGNWSISDFDRNQPISFALVTVTDGNTEYQFDLSKIEDDKQQELEKCVIGGLYVSEDYVYFLLYPSFARLEGMGVHIIRAEIDGDAVEIFSLGNEPEWNLVSPPVWKDIIAADGGFITFDYYGTIYKIDLLDMEAKELFKTGEFFVSDLSWYDGYVLAVTKQSTDAEIKTLFAYRDGEIRAAYKTTASFCLPSSP